MRSHINIILCLRTYCKSFQRPSVYSYMPYVNNDDNSVYLPICNSIPFYPDVSGNYAIDHVVQICSSFVSLCHTTECQSTFKISDKRRQNEKQISNRDPRKRKIFLLTLCSANGIGINTIPKNASKVLAHPTPKFLYMAVAKAGKPAPKELRMKSLPASTEAAYSG